MFSFIIPVYNSERYIIKCINSILNQSEKNFEIIIVDDGSSDDSVKLIKQLKSDKIRILSKKNGGLSSARNYGIKYVKYDYIWFVDSDDYIEQNALHELLKIIKRKKYDVIAFQHYKDFSGKKVIIKDDGDRKSMHQNILVNTSACTKIFKASFFKKHGFKFPEGKIYEDLALIPFVLSCAESFYYLECPLYNYVYRNNSIMNTKSFNDNRDDKFFAINNLYSLFSKRKDYFMYYELLEYLTIKHLLIVYSSEILPYGKKIYYNRCNRVLDFLNNNNSNWYHNDILKKSSFKSRIYVLLFRKRFFKICNFLVKINNSMR